MRRRLIGTTISVVLVVGVTGLWWYLNEYRMPPASVAAREVPEVLAQLPTNPDAVAASHAETRLDNGYFGYVPPSSHLEADPDTWFKRTHNTGMMLMNVTPPGGETQEYAAIVKYRRGAWEVLDVRMSMSMLRVENS